MTRARKPIARRCAHALCVAVAVASVVVVAAGCRAASSSAESQSKLQLLPGLDDAMAAQGVAAVNGATPEERSEMAMKFLIELERPRLGGDFVGGWRALSKAPPRERGRLAAEAISENLGMLDAACEVSGTEAMRRAAEINPADKSKEIFAMCDFGRHGLIDEQTAARTEPMPMVLAHMAFAHIEAHGGVSQDERLLLRAAAGTTAAPVQ